MTAANPNKSLAKTPRRAESVLVACLLTVAGLILQQATTLDADAGYSGISSAVFPFAVGAGLACCALLLAREVLTGGLRHGEAYVEAPPRLASATQLLWVGAGLLLQMALIGRVGFVLASTLLLVFVARGFGSQQWLRDAAIGLAVTLPVQQLFTRFLGLNLPLLPFLGQ